jgi:hypothetical protein
MARNDDLLAVALAFGIALSTVVLAHVLPVAKGADEPSTPGSFREDPGCSEWTDGCIVCRRGDQGPVCSTPGIACVPHVPRCLRRERA